jgi:asparagine synthase (glutamine-hydrolysing)
MCGITGIFDTRGTRPIDQTLLARMTDALALRGPDGDGLYVRDGIGLGHRRLSIIDLEGGVQPMSVPETGVTVSYNGEIYNFQRLRDDLQAKGYVFHTSSDTEVILHGWDAWGPDCVDHFDGFFAFALWDPRTETLFIARDRLGKKPL